MNVQELLDNARRNEALLRRLQAFELQLLSCQNWADLLTLLLRGLPEQFGLEAVTLTLLDHDGALKTAWLHTLTPEQFRLASEIELVTRLLPGSAGPLAPQPPFSSSLNLPLERNGVQSGRLVLHSANPERFRDGLAFDFMQHLAAVIAACLVMVRQSEEQARLALTDPLTGAENRRGFARAFEREWARGLRHYHAFAMLLIDLDHFKQINDLYGHATGDRALKILCQTLSGLLRPTDHIGRLGGEEFALLIPGCDTAQLPGLVSRVQEAIRAISVPDDQGNPVRLTASGSYLSLIPRPHSPVTLATVLGHLDTCLYQAKHSGRDRFIQAG